LIARRKSSFLTGSIDMRQNLLLAAALFAVTFIVFWPTGQHDYINLDDQAYVSENPHVNKGLTAEGMRWAFTTHHGGSWHPITWLSHMLDVQLFGLKAGPQHLISVAIHAASSAMLFLALFAMTNSRWPGLAVAAVWALHPLRVESVAWVAERKDVLSGFFFIAMLWAYAHYARYAQKTEARNQRPEVSQSQTDLRPPSALWPLVSGSYWLALLLFLLGLMSKPMLVSVPFVLLLLDWWPLNRIPFPIFDLQKSKKPLIEKLPFVIIAVVFCILTLRSQDDVGAVISVEKIPLATRVVNAFNSIVMYSANTLWPERLNPFYAFDTPTVAWTALLVLCVTGVTTLALWWGRQKPFFFVGWFWFVIMLVPVLGLVQVGSQARADRYTYLPSIGLLIALVWLMISLAPKAKFIRASLAVLLAIALVGLSLTTQHQLKFWKNAITYCERSVAIEPRDARSHFNLGCTLEKLGDHDRAIKHFEAAIATSAAYIKAHNNLGSALAGKGDFAGATEHFREAVRLNPHHTSARLNLARSLVSQGRLAEAVAELQAAPPEDPPVPALFGMAADLLLRLGRTREAIAALEQLLKINPAAELHEKVAMLNVQIGEAKLAVAHYHAALKMKPDWAEVLNNLAWTLATHSDASVRNGPEAILLAQRACKLTQYGQPVFLVTLAAAYAEAGKFDEAISNSQKALDVATQAGNTQLVASITPLHNTFVSRQPFHTPP
jgi:protein O-mannosyl-transferase